ncbi:MAG: hypothetical protein IT437_05825 [Phycisphaerales bacterium]|nr:hypothetical protein [Phycisphaerales bacterium]
MAKGQHLTRHQQGIVKRYYEHRDTISLQKLAELVSELYLADAKKATKLWESARVALATCGGDAKRIDTILLKKDVVGLAALVNELSGGK